MNKASWKKLITTLLFSIAVSAMAFGQEAAHPTWSVDGTGILENRRLRKQLELISSGDKEFFQASDVEDAALVLLSFLQGQGYLGAEATVTISHRDGHEEKVEWDGKFDVFLPRETRAKSVDFSLRKGPRYYYKSLEVEEGSGLADEEVETFFYSEGLLLQGAKARVFTPSALNSGAANLENHLRSLGYQDAKVSATELSRDDSTGAVTAKVRVERGIYYYLNTINVQVDGETISGLDLSGYRDQAYSRFLLQDIRKYVRNAYFKEGYPNVRAEIKTSLSEAVNDRVNVATDVVIVPGDRIRISAVTISGREETREATILKRIEVEEGDWLNPLEVDRSRMALGRLGIFKEVAVSLEDDGASAKAIDFQLAEREPWSLDVLFGWGSYEQLRGGVIAERINILGKAHRARFTGTLSMKSSLTELSYLMPEIFKTPTSVTSKLYSLSREEISSERVEIGANFGLSRRFERYDLESAMLYTFESLEAKNVRGDVDPDTLDEARVGSLQLRLGRDKRDSPINPKDGNRFYTKVELAAKELGGQVNYQRLELGFSSHGDWGRGLYWHGGMSHGVIETLYGSDEELVPLNKLFYPGGESSIRGYQAGEASPRDANGINVGARSYVLANFEIEQYLNEKLSVLLFVDGVGITRTLDEYPFDETLASVGLGLRFKTFMGPLRLEYGRNIKKRVADDDGALHFSIGFPF